MAHPLALLPSPARDVWHLGAVSLRAQALAVVAGILVAIVVAELRYRRAGGPPGAIADIAAWAVPAALVPAAVAALTAAARAPLWRAAHAAAAAAGFPGAVALGLLAAWLACRRMRAPVPAAPVAVLADESPPAAPPRRVRLGPVLGAGAPAVAFGQAVGLLGDWFAQQGIGRPSSLPWSIAISPLHRPPGYENYATFAPLFIYQVIWDVTAGVAVIAAAGRWNLAGGRVFALGCAAYAIGGFGVFWLGIGHLPVILGLPAGVLGDVAVLAGAVIYLLRTRRTGPKSVQNPHKPTLERDSPVM